MAKSKRLNGPLKAQLVLGWREKIWLARCDLPFAPFPGLIIRVDEHESLNFARLLSEFAEDGLGILLVEHDMDLVMGVCSTIHVLDFGTILAVGSPTEIQTNPAVQEAYLGGVGGGVGGGAA